MLRKKIFHAQGNSTIRGAEIFRIEALSDAVFAFSVSLLIMSLEVPETFRELQQTLLHVLPFLATVSLVFFFWYLQNEYFRTYGLNDGKVIFLNLSLLVLILFYAFPLKFLFSVLLSWITGINYFTEMTEQGKTILTQEEFPQLIVFFSIGYAAIWLLFYLLYRHAAKKKHNLNLSPHETIYVKAQQRDAAVQCAIGVLGLLFALWNLPIASGVCFLFIPLWLVTHNYFVKRRINHLVQRK